MQLATSKSMTCGSCHSIIDLSQGLGGELKHAIQDEPVQPLISSNGQRATYLGTAYQLKESYNAETNYVLGEFYWQVSRGQKTNNRDYASGKSLLSMEQSPQDLTWSVGGKIHSDVVVQAFQLEGKKDLLQRSDVGPFTAAKNPFARPAFLIFVVFVVVILLVSQCSRCDPKVENCSSSGSGYRTSGGSYGGYSGGGGHK